MYILMLTRLNCDRNAMFMIYVNLKRVPFACFLILKVPCLHATFYSVVILHIFYSEHGFFFN